eukprot:TRINITY_DN6268_c0_g1_i3.p1 TRINITY_DN6268_c0_g1~~TRINITY_DN6268_c0_g1_i3.p1  ORF type:complete len:185 (+),score=1.94 TRINITY_DN6268_c0_g1_i3:23-556(+)
MALHQKLQACLHEASNYADIYTLDHVKGAVANDPELQVQLSTLFGSVSVFIEQVKSLKRSGSLEFRHIWLVIEPRLWQLEAEHSSTRDLYGGDGTVQLFVYEAGFGLPSLSLQCTTALNILQLYKVPLIFSTCCTSLRHYFDIFRFLLRSLPTTTRPCLRTKLCLCWLDPTIPLLTA